MSEKDRITADQLHELLEQNKLGPDGERRILRSDLQALLENPSRFRVAHPSGDSTIYKVTIDYSLTLKQMIEAGSYDWVNDDITPEHFKVTGEGSEEVELHLIHFGVDLSTEEVEKRLDQMNLRPAKIEHLLSLGATHPNLQREYPIVAFGSWVGPSELRYVPYLFEGDRERGLRLRWYGYRWHGDCRFLALSK